MSDQKTVEAVENEKPVASDIDLKSRLDEFGETMFQGMGYEIPFPDSLVAVYNGIKTRKDKYHPGKLTPEGFAIVSLLSDWIDNRIDLTGK